MEIAMDILNLVCVEPRKWWERTDKPVHFLKSVRRFPKCCLKLLLGTSLGEGEYQSEIKWIMVDREGFLIHRSPGPMGPLDQICSSLKFLVLTNSTSGWWPRVAMGPHQRWETPIQKGTALGLDFPSWVVLFCISGYLDTWSEWPGCTPPAVLAICHQDGHFQVGALQGWRIFLPLNTPSWSTLHLLADRVFLWQLSAATRVFQRTKECSQCW